MFPGWTNDMYKIVHPKRNEVVYSVDFGKQEIQSPVDLSRKLLFCFRFSFAYIPTLLIIIFILSVFDKRWTRKWPLFIVLLLKSLYQPWSECSRRQISFSALYPGQKQMGHFNFGSGREAKWNRRTFCVAQAVAIAIENIACIYADVLKKWFSDGHIFNR